MENVHCFLETYRVDHSIGAAIIVFDDLQNTSASETFERLGRGMLVARLRELKRPTELSLDVLGKAPKFPKRLWRSNDRSHRCQF